MAKALSMAKTQRPARARAVPVIFPLAGRRVAVAGSGGMVGSALVRRLGS